MKNVGLSFFRTPAKIPPPQRARELLGGEGGAAGESGGEAAREHLRRMVCREPAALPSPQRALELLGEEGGAAGEFGGGGEVAGAHLL